MAPRPSRNTQRRRRAAAPSAAAVLLLAATATIMVGPQGASARPLRDPNNPIPASGTYQAAQQYHAGTAVPGGGGAESELAAGHAAAAFHQQQQEMEQQHHQEQQQQPPPYYPSYGGSGGNYAVAGGATTREGYAASATGGAVGALWPQAMAQAARTGGGPFAGPYGGYGGGMYGRNGFYYGRDRTQWPNHSAGSMAIAGGQTAAIASTGKASAAAFGGRKRLQ
jgi:hypothetical protein